MALDYGQGVPGPYIGGPPPVAAMRIEYETLNGYKNLVDDLLEKLDGSAAADKKLADGTLPAGALGQGFPAAAQLQTAYTTVHEQLMNLSQGLSAQIEGLGIAIRTAGKGFAGIDEETRRRMAAISAKAHEDYVPERDPLYKAPASSGTAADDKVTL
ncbi:DUF2563 family protein [Streptomyces sp. NPDC059999]|uniref:DUF2563 family protein n=1 Tax=Streptomyces sp. NPDC059999 TaxID=3347030 RepID=UPI0036A709DD